MPHDHIVVTRRIPQAGLRLLYDAGARVSILQDDSNAPLDRAALLDGIADADVIVSLLTETLDADTMDFAPRLVGIANMAVGYNNIDVPAASRRGITVTNTPGVLTESTADLTFALLLSVARRIPEAHAYMTAGRFRIWGPELLLGADVGTGTDGHPRTLGIIGYGRIGRAVARRARGFDMRVITYSPSSRAEIEAAGDVEYAELDTLIRESDFITLHPRLTPETRRIIDEQRLRAMKDTAFLVNVARGEMVDERALVTALREHWIAGAALDVFEHEPAMALGLADCPNTVLVPHIGSATTSTRNRMAVMAAHNAVAMLRGETPPNPVT